MKKYLLMAACILAGALTFTSCSKDDDDKNEKTASAEVKAIEELSKQYAEAVVFPTYTNLANATETLYEQLEDAKQAFRKGSLTQGDIDKICATFLNARSFWEQSEAFLYGPATTFGIDPHIDTWPLDLDALALALKNSDQVAMLDNGDDGIAYAGAKLGQELLGFHGIEFIIFRDGNNRTLSSLQSNESDKAFTAISANVTGEQELIYATAVAGDLRDKCFQLEVAWRGESASQSHRDRLEECEYETQIGSNYYGDHISKATMAGSIYQTWQEVLTTIFDSGCSNICNEVANTKMGLAYTGEDPNYIESPYSKKSFQDFYDNIQSIKSSLYGGVGLSSPASRSIMALTATYNPSLATALESKLAAALQALQACQQGTAFVDDPKAAKVKAAMDAINALDEELATGARWAATIK